MGRGMPELRARIAQNCAAHHLLEEDAVAPHVELEALGAVGVRLAHVLEGRGRELRERHEAAVLLRRLRRRHLAVGVEHPLARARRDEERELRLVAEDGGPHVHVVVADAVEDGVAQLDVVERGDRAAQRPLRVGAAREVAVHHRVRAPLGDRLEVVDVDGVAHAALVRRVEDRHDRRRERRGDRADRVDDAAHRLLPRVLAALHLVGRLLHLRGARARAAGGGGGRRAGARRAERDGAAEGLLREHPGGSRRGVGERRAKGSSTQQKNRCSAKLHRRSSIGGCTRAQLARLPFLVPRSSREFE